MAFVLYGHSITLITFVLPLSFVLDEQVIFITLI